jgi:hypothetical protein
VDLARKAHLLSIGVVALALIPNLPSGWAAEQPGSIGSGFLENTGIFPDRINFAIPINLAKDLVRSNCPAALALPTVDRTKLEPGAIFRAVSPSVVMILNYPAPAIVSTNGMLIMSFPTMPTDLKAIEMVPVGSGDRLFLMDRYEITQAQFLSLMGHNPSQFQLGPDYPLEGVSWEGAQQFCTNLTAVFRSAATNGVTFATPAMSNWVFRLPTDAEWSLAVGLEQEEGATPKEKDSKVTGVYPWGNEWPPPSGAGNYADVATKRKYRGIATIEGYEDGYPETAPVGSFKSNRYGLYDLGGNVWEWCQDWFDETKQQRVVRGASWRNGPPEALLSSKRGNNVQNGRFHNIGFRIVFAPPLGS